MKILVASLIRDRAWILPDFLRNIRVLEVPEGVEVEYYFLVDNSTDKSFEITYNTVIGKDIKKPLWGAAVVAYNTEESEQDPRGYYARVKSGTYTHLQKLREKLRLIAVEGKYDYLLVVDCDILVEPDLLCRLLDDKKDFVAATISNDAQGAFTAVNALDLKCKRLNNPYARPPRLVAHQYVGGRLVKVGVTGACYLIRKEVLKKCSYFFEPTAQENSLIKSSFGEDVWFAISCVREGFTQWLDESVTAFHAYTQEFFERRFGKRGKAGK